MPSETELISMSLLFSSGKTVPGFENRVLKKKKEESRKKKKSRPNFKIPYTKWYY